MVRNHESKTSSTPPCPGIRLFESFMDTLRFNTDSSRSDNMTILPKTIPIQNFSNNVKDICSLKINSIINTVIIEKIIALMQPA